MNQNLLIVDDEYDILTWLEEMFKYEFDLEIGVYTASSAIEALDWLNKVKFDVVLTDIRMPGMDGITLFQKIKSNWPRCKTVFLTGYRNFDDMYKIINHKDVRYILKSEEDEVIQKAVRESLLEFREELEKESLVKKHEEESRKVKYWMSKDFLNSLMSGDFSDTQQEVLQRKAEELNIPISFSVPFLLFLIRLDGTGEKALPDAIVILEDLSRMLRDNIPEDINVTVHPTENRQAVIFIQPAKDGQQDWQRIYTVTQGAVEYAQIILKQNYRISFSAVTESTPVTYCLTAKTAARLKQIMVGYLGAETEVIVHEEVIDSDKEKETPGDSFARISLLKSYLELRKRQNYFDVLSECAKELTETKSRHDTHAIELYYSIAIMLLQFINENQMNEKIAFQIGLYKLTKVDEHASWPAAGQYLFEVSNSVFHLLDDNGNVLSDRALKRVTKYIEENLAGDLSLTNLANVGGFNASYLSRLFKQVYKTTISDYIYRKRMNLAKKLLTGSSLKIQDIAVKTGYISSHSFARTFRSYSGISPVEYRELNRI